MNYGATLKRRHRGKRKPYVWQHAANWDRDSWNGVSYTGNEPNMIRMRFERRQKAQGKRANWGRTYRWMLRSARQTYRGLELCRILAMYKRVLRKSATASKSRA